MVIRLSKVHRCGRLLETSDDRGGDKPETDHRTIDAVRRAYSTLA